METVTTQPKTVVFSALNPPLNPILVKDAAGLQELAQFLDSVDVVGLDIETNIADFFFQRRVRTIQIGNRERQYVVDLWELAGRSDARLEHLQGDYGARLYECPELTLLVDLIRRALESNRVLKLGYNLRFEYETLKWCLGLRPWHLYDIYLGERIIYNGVVKDTAKNFWGLDDTALRYLNVKVDKAEQKTFWGGGELTEAQLNYAAFDVRLLFVLKERQEVYLAKHKLNRTLKIENDALPAFGDMHLNGLLINTAKWMGLVNETKTRHALNIEELDKLFIPVVGVKGVPAYDLAKMENDWRVCKDKEKRAQLRTAFMDARREVKEAAAAFDKCEGQAAINYGSNPQLLKALRKMGFGEKKLRSTNDQNLKRLAGEPVIDALRNYRETEKILSTYGEGFLEKYIRIETGRVHSVIKQLGAETGRSSSVKPNVQNILRGANWRGCFVARPGYKILTIDYNGCELRILAELSKEPVWLDAFNNGWDVHSVGAEILFGKRWADAIVHEAYDVVKDGKTKTIPRCAYKYNDHKKCDCPGHKKLRDQIKAINFGLAYGMEYKKLAEDLGISHDDAKKLMAEYKGQFVVVTAYLEESGNAAVGSLESRTLCGRRRQYREPNRARATAIAKKRLKENGLKPTDLTVEMLNQVLGSLWAGIKREGKNTPIQGSNADIAKLAMGCGFGPDGKPYAWHIIEPKYNAMMCNFVHDEFVVEAKDEVAQPCFDEVSDCMKRAGAEFVKLIPMETEGHIADHWTK